MGGVFLMMNWRHWKLDSHHLVCLSCKQWLAFTRNKKKHYQQSHGKTLHSKMNHRIHSLTCVDVRKEILKDFQSWRKGQHLHWSHHSAVLPCQALSPALTSSSFQPFFPPSLPKAPGPKVLPKPLCCAAYPAPMSSTSTNIMILCHAAAGFGRLLVEQILHYLCTGIHLWNLS